MSKNQALLPVKPKVPQLVAPVPLQLSATRGQLSLELRAPASFGPLLVSALALSLPGLKFPLDLSGGVSRFRNRRGVLESIQLRLSLAQLCYHLAPNVKNVLGPSPSTLELLPASHGLAIGLSTETEALTFNALFAPEEECLRFVVCEARSVGLNVPSHGAALRAAEALAGRFGRRQGSLVIFDQAIQRLVRELLIDAGARAPDTSGMRFRGWQETAEGFELEATREGEIPALPASVIRALETARLAEKADEALARGELQTARAACLQALESAPRHPDLSVRLAEIDQLAGQGVEGALGWLVEAMPAVEGGLVAARLLAATGDREAAMVACRNAAQREPSAKLASLLLREAAGYASSLADRVSLLDEAVARAPGLATSRWARAQMRVDVGDVRSAAADLEGIEASVEGLERRFEVCLRAGKMMAQAQAADSACRFFRRALRYVPNSPEATAGLARSLLAINEGARAVNLLRRAVMLTERGDPAPDLLLELALALADIARDLPAAIAHARRIPFGLPQTIAARALEGRWRAMLGDLVGAGHAFALARSALESVPETPEAAADWMLEAARFELDVRGDLQTAQQHLAIAVQRSPHHATVLSLFREIGYRIAKAEPPPAKPEQTAPSVVAAPLPEPSPTPPQVEDDEAQIARLTQVVQGNPKDRQAVQQLCALLERCKRFMDLFALVSARLEEENSQDDIRLLRNYRVVALRALAEQARAEGRPDEARLYDEALQDSTDAP